MLIAFLIWCSKRYGNTLFSTLSLNAKTAKKSILKKKKLLLSLLLFSCLQLNAQEVQHVYNIFKGKDIIGAMTVKRTVKGDSVFYTMSSHFKTRFVFSVIASTTEQSVFYKGMLLQSNFYRIINGKVSCDNKAKWNGLKYEIDKSGKPGSLPISSIQLNMAMLMFSKPVHTTQLFSDHFHSLVELKQIAADKYFVQLPDNTNSTYHYQGNLCSTVEIRGSMFNVKLVLVS